MRSLKTVIGFGFFLALSSCAPFVGNDQPNTYDNTFILEKGKAIGQTFVARNDGLAGVELFLVPLSNLDGTIRYHLKPEPESAEALTTDEISVDTLLESGNYWLTFDPQKDSRGEYYYFYLEFDGIGTIGVGFANGDQYLDGALYEKHIPQDAQATFRLLYEPAEALLGVGEEIITWVGILTVAVFLYIIPGYAILIVLWPRNLSFNLPLKIAIGSGISLSLYPILFLLTDLIGLHLGPLYAWAPSLGGLFVLFWKGRGHFTLGQIRSKINTWLHSNELWSGLSLAFIATLIILVRFFAIRSIDVPMWGDSLQHTMIAQLLVDNNGLFDSWQPYTDLTTFTYHFGFHTHIATFHWLTGLPMYRATLWVGQIMNSLAVFTLYPLAIQIGKRRSAAILAILISGLISPMPMYYINWGRFTQLAGQAILPIAIFFAWNILRRERPNWGEIALAWILWGGLALTHYRVLIFGILFFPIYIILHFRKLKISQLVTRTAQIGIISAIIFLPWFINVFSGRILDVAAIQLTTPVENISPFLNAYNSINELSIYLPIWLWLIALLCLFWVFWKKELGSKIIFIWWMSILLIANPQILKIPGAGVLTNFAIFIFAYFPASLIIGASVSSFLTKYFSSTKSIILTIVLLLGTIFGFNQPSLVQPSLHTYATRPDLQANEWLRDNTTDATRVLVHSAFAYGNSVIVGTDGGWWLPMLSGLKSSAPPLNYGTEEATHPEYVNRTNELFAEIVDKGIDHPNVKSLLEGQQISHIYIGQRQGSVNSAPIHNLLPQTLNGISSVQLIYHQDRVWIYKFK